jgi:hypothetical protein
MFFVVVCLLLRVVPSLAFSDDVPLRDSLNFVWATPILSRQLVPEHLASVPGGLNMQLADEIIELYSRFKDGRAAIVEPAGKTVNDAFFLWQQEHFQKEGKLIPEFEDSEVLIQVGTPCHFSAETLMFVSLSLLPPLSS